MTTINRVPPGLLSVLDVKAQGENPRDLSRTVSPTLDLFPLYELERRRSVSSSISAVTTVGFQAGVTVPSSEYWHVIHHAVFLSGIAAGEIVNFCAYVFCTINSGTYFEGPVGPNWLTGGVTTEAPSNYADREYWLGPGDQLGLRINDIRAGTVSVQSRAIIVPYPL